MFIEFRLARSKDAIAVDLKNIKEIAVEAYVDQNNETLPCTVIRFYQGGDDENILVAEDFSTVLRRINDARKKFSN